MVPMKVLLRQLSIWPALAKKITKNVLCTLSFFR
jgi:hypothetical protein